MYGLLLEAIKDIITNAYGEDIWEATRQHAGLEPESFSTHDVYPETHIPRIMESAAHVLNRETDDIMYQFGMGFVLFVSRYEYDKILRVLGRHMRDFLNGLDNLHDHMRFSYQYMSAPSFFVENESKDGLTLHYRTRRRGFVHYVMGQITQAGRLLYNTDVEIEVMSQTERPDGTLHVEFHLKFDNSAFRDSRDYCEVEDSTVASIPLRAEVLFELFPFHVVFAKDMLIRSVGSALDAVAPDLVGQSLTDSFRQARPLTTFGWDEVPPLRN